MRLRNDRIELNLNVHGAVVSLKIDREEWALAGDCPLFGWGFLSACDGSAVECDSNEFPEPESVVERNGTEQKLRLLYRNHPQIPGLMVWVSVRLRDGDCALYWQIRAEGIPPGLIPEWVEYPNYPAPDDVGKGEEEAKVFWPGYEGVLFDDFSMRNADAYFRSARLKYPLTGVGAYYPGVCAMQFQAYCRKNSGLYFACNDPEHAPKGIHIYHKPEHALCFTFQHFVGAHETMRAEVAYEVEMRHFKGDWQDACLLYRQWMEEHDAALPLKLRDNPLLPEWLTAAPVILIYPVKGAGFDSGSLEGNEYFPYQNALPILERYAKNWHTSVMALLMHWEGTAPWAPPYVWPPYGGEEMLRNFADSLHKQGNLLGVYASGIGWTQTSSIDPRYRRDAQFERENLGREMCRGPRDEMFALICNGGPGKGQRIGYELCPSRRFTRDTVCEEIRKIVRADVDYLQFFDQNQGAGAPLCYAGDHGHPRAPGIWLTEAMRTLTAEAMAAVRHEGKQAVLGCENAAAEPYIRDLPFNDVRNNLAWAIARPVPAYAFLFHEYTNNFSGNAVSLGFWVDYELSPEFFFYRLGMSFAAGEVLAVVLKNAGHIHYNWVYSWSLDGPDQELAVRWIGHLNDWRRGKGHPWLVFGRMEKDITVSAGSWTLKFRNGHPEQLLPCVISSHWSYEGREAEFLVNPFDCPRRVTLQLGAVRHGWLHNDPEPGTHADSEFFSEQLECEIAPYHAVLIELEAQ